MAINKTTTETKSKIKANSVIALPNRPQIPAEQLKQAFVKPIVDTSNSMIQELDRIVEETNAELEQVQVDITDAIDEHNTDTEATHLDIRQTIENLDNTLQEQIDTINGTLSEHDFRINELEDFASNLETDITEEIEQALSGKADLVDGKVPLEQLPDVEDVLTGDITSHNHATEIGNHNSSGTAHSDIRTAINNLQSAITTLQNIIGTVGGDDENEVIDKLQEVFKVLEDFEEDSNLVSILANKVDIDDLPIVIGYLSSGVFYKDSGLTQAITGSTSKIYIDIKENNKKIYWFNGTVYEEISKPLSLGTGSNQAYYGDLGNTAYLHSQSAHAPSNAQKNVQSDWNQTDNTKDDYIKNKPTIPTLRPTIELEVASLTTLTELEKLTIKNQLSLLIVDDKIDGSKFDDIVLVTTTDLIRLHYSSIDYYVANPQITVIFETENTKYTLHVPLIEYTYSTLTSTTTTIPTISTSITTDATDDTKTASPKAVKTYVDNVLGDIETLLEAL